MSQHHFSIKFSIQGQERTCGALIKTEHSDEVLIKNVSIGTASGVTGNALWREGSGSAARLTGPMNFGNASNSFF